MSFPGYLTHLSLPISSVALFCFVLLVVSGAILIKVISLHRPIGASAAVGHGLGQSLYGQKRPRFRSQIGLIRIAGNGNSRTRLHSGSNRFYIHNFTWGSDSLCKGNGNKGELTC